MSRARKAKRRAKQVRPDRRVMSMHEAEATYRLRHGTIAAEIKAGLLAGRKRGRATIVSVKAVEELHGVPS